MLELIHTSVPQGLKENSSGFCSVAWTAGMPANLILPLEQLSAYKALYPFGDPGYGLNPVSYAYQRIKYGGAVLHVLSRIAAAGLDYSGRSNKIAHHILLGKDDIASPDFSPAALCRNRNTFVTEWKLPPEELPPRHIVTAREIIRPSVNWGETAGSPAWAGVIAGQFVQDPAKAVYVEYPEGFSTDVLLLLITEVASLLTKEQAAEFTFNTYFTSLANGGSCFLRFCPKGSPTLRSAERIASNRIIRLMKPNELPPSSENSYWGVYARTGTPPKTRLPEQDNTIALQKEVICPAPAGEAESAGADKKEKPNTDYLFAENMVLRKRLELSRRRQQLIIGVCILASVVAAAIVILFFSRTDSPPVPPISPEAPPRTEEKGTPGASKTEPGAESPVIQTQAPPVKPRTAEKTPGEKKSPEQPVPVSPPEKKQAPAPAEQAAVPGKKEQAGVKRPPVKNQISEPSAKSLFEFLKLLTPKMMEKESFSASYALPPELANAAGLSVVLTSIGANTNNRIVENIQKYVRKIPGGVRIHSAFYTQNEGVYEYTPVTENFLEVTVKDKQLHLAKTVSRKDNRINSPLLSDIAMLTFDGSKKVSITCTLNMAMLKLLPFGKLERGSVNRYDFALTVNNENPRYFIYKRSPEENRFANIVDFRFEKEDDLFYAFEQWNGIRATLSKSRPKDFSAEEDVLKKLEALAKEIGKFEKEYPAIYKESDPVCFGGFRACRSFRQMDELVKGFTLRKKQYEKEMLQVEKRRKRKGQNGNVELFVRVRQKFDELEDFNISNRKLLRNIVDCNLSIIKKQHAATVEKTLQAFLAKHIQSVPVSPAEKEKVKKALKEKQQVSLFRDGPNRCTELEDYFTRTWVKRTVKQVQK